MIRTRATSSRRPGGPWRSIPFDVLLHVSLISLKVRVIDVVLFSGSRDAAFQKSGGPPKEVGNCVHLSSTLGIGLSLSNNSVPFYIRVTEVIVNISHDWSR